MPGHATECKISFPVNLLPLPLLFSVQSTLQGLRLPAGQKKPGDSRQEGYVIDRGVRDWIAYLLVEEAKLPQRWKPQSSGHPVRMPTAAMRMGQLFIWTWGDSFLTHTLTLTHVLAGGEHTEESANTEERMRCDIPATGVTFISPKRLLCEFLNGMNEIIDTWLILHKVLR